MKHGEKAISEASLEVWDNPSPECDYIIDISFPEFTCLCPFSGYPDFANIRIIYKPNKNIIELRSLKLYLNKYRSEYISHEEATSRIYLDLVSALSPKELEVIGDFNIRGGIKTIVRMKFNANKEGNN
ncbi:MAG: NADPH-dependent 7-cyano-7-deazaguanine reductase QueF [Methanotrichaceae archaeon]|nr:NADPH-dependent 7-cyano-7-deazaguanine reductase QueF [Methanotrichaceae archaeon]